MEARVAIGRLLERFRAVEPGDAPTRDRRVRFRGFTTLPARLVPR
jgi:cytochrome P450